MARTKGSDDLFKLIHSLTPEEKGYFKKFARRHADDGNKYLQLFDAINAQEKFEEAGLRKTFKGYADMKAYLLTMVLDALMLLEMNSSEVNKTIKQWFHVNILNRKGLRSKAIQVSKKALQQAKEMELFWLEHPLRKKLFDMEKHSWKIAEREVENAALFADLKRAVAGMQQTDGYFEVFQKLSNYSNQWAFAGKQAMPLEQVTSIAELEREKSDVVTVERLRIATISMYYMLKQDFEKQYEVAKHYYSFEKKIWQSKSLLADYDKYVKAIRAFILAALYTDRAEEVFALNEEMYAAKGTGELERVENELCYFTYNQYAYWGTGRHKEGEKFSQQYFPDKLIEQHGSRFRLFILEFHRYKILFEFANKSHKQLFNSIAAFQSLGVKKDATSHYKSCELLKVLANVELNAFDVLPQMAANAITHLEAYGLTEGEKRILTALRKMNSGNKKEILNKLLSSFEKDATATRIFMAFNIRTWLRTQIEGRPFTAVFSDNRKAKGDA